MDHRSKKAKLTSIQKMTAYHAMFKIKGKAQEECLSFYLSPILNTSTEESENDWLQRETHLGFDRRSYELSLYFDIL